MLLELAQWLAQDVRAVQRLQLHHAARGARRPHRARDLADPRAGVIRKLTAYKIGQAVRDDGPQSHLTKAGTPTMGGALILVSSRVTTLLWGDLANRFVWVVLLVTLGFGIDRLGRRLPQGRAPQPEGAVGAGEVLLAVGDRPRRRGLPRVRGADRDRDAGLALFTQSVAAGSRWTAAKAT